MGVITPDHMPEGGEYWIEMQGALEACMAERPNEDKGYRTAASDRYVRVVPNELLVFTWKGDCLRRRRW